MVAQTLAVLGKGSPPATPQHGFFGEVIAPRGARGWPITGLPEDTQDARRTRPGLHLFHAGSSPNPCHNYRCPQGTRSPLEGRWPPRKAPNKRTWLELGRLACDHCKAREPNATVLSTSTAARGTPGTHVGGTWPVRGSVFLLPSCVASQDAGPCLGTGVVVTAGQDEGAHRSAQHSGG